MTRIGICLVILIGILSACASRPLDAQTTKPSRAEEEIQISGADSTFSRQEMDDLIAQENQKIEKLTLEDEGDYYKLFSMEDEQYYAQFYHQNGVSMYQKTSRRRVPQLDMITDDIIRYRIQLGTGVTAQSTFYYDSRTGQISPEYYAVQDEYEHMIIYADIFDEAIAIKVQDMFSAEKVYLEIKDYPNEINSIDSGRLTAAFSADGKAVLVHYQEIDNDAITTKKYLLSSE